MRINCKLLPNKKKFLSIKKKTFQRSCELLCIFVEDPGHRGRRQTISREASDGTANANFPITCRCLYVHCPGPKNFAREHCAFLLVDENREEKREEDKDTWGRAKRGSFLLPLKNVKLAEQERE